MAYMKNMLDHEFFNEPYIYIYILFYEKERKKKIHHETNEKHFQACVRIPRSYCYDIVVKWKSNGPRGMNSYDVLSDI